MLGKCAKFAKICTLLKYAKECSIICWKFKEIKRWIMYCVLIFLGTKATRIIQLTCFVAVQLIPLHQKNVKYKVLKMFALKRDKKFRLAESCTNTAHGSNCPIYPYLCPRGTRRLYLEGKYTF